MRLDHDIHFLRPHFAAIRHGKDVGGLESVGMSYWTGRGARRALTTTTTTAAAAGAGAGAGAAGGCS